MGKPALGKGMRDLIAKNFGVEDREVSATDGQKALDELETILARYQAQGYDVSYLLSLREGTSQEIASGIDAYRVAIKLLAGAQTQLRTLEGYGYTKEIEAISADIRDPLKAEDVLRKVEELKERALSEHNIKPEKKAPSKVRLPESLKLASRKLKEETACHPERADEGVLDGKCLDDLLDNLEDLSDVLTVQEEADPQLSKIGEWEAKGYFVDRLKTAFSEGRDVAEAEISRFEEDLKELELLRARFREMDMTGFEKERKELEMRFQYPHLWFEIKAELDRISAQTGEGRPERPIEVVPEPGAIKGASPVEIPPEPGPGPEKVEPPPQQGPYQVGASEEAPAPSGPEGPGPAEEKAVPEISLKDLSNEQLLESAKDAYSQERLEEALALFKELLARDPEDSKAKFMMRRIASKLG